MFNRVYLLLVLLLATAGAHAQNTLTADSVLLRPLPPAATTPLPDVQEALRPWMKYIFTGRDFEAKLKANTTVVAYFQQLLKRTDSYDFGFDSLITVSRLYPEDQTFRLFTWQYTDPSGNANYAGLVQRRIATDKGQTELRVIVLQDVVDRSEDVERTPLDNTRWLGAIYYKPRYSEFGILSQRGEIMRMTLAGKTRKEKTTHYVIFGYNGHNATSNYKILDVIHFDPRDPEKVYFGAPLFYSGAAPKLRCVFKYTDNSVFTLNRAQIMDGKKKAWGIVFDHLAAPQRNDQRSVWTYGADGTVDGYQWYDKWYEQRKGFFGLRKNVNVYDPSLEQYDPREQQRRMEEERKRLRTQGIEFDRNNQGGNKPGNAPAPVDN